MFSFDIYNTVIYFILFILCVFVFFFLLQFFASFAPHSIRNRIHFNFTTQGFEYFEVKKVELYVNQMTYNHQSKTSCCLKAKRIRNRMEIACSGSERNASIAKYEFDVCYLVGICKCLSRNQHSVLKLAPSLNTGK